MIVILENLHPWVQPTLEQIPVKQPLTPGLHSGTHYTDQAGLELMEVLLSAPPSPQPPGLSLLLIPSIY